MSAEDVFETPPVDGIAVLPEGPGIYGMWNRVTGMWNIGQSVNIYQRCLLHRSQLRAGTHGNMRMRRDVDKYGADVYFYMTLELVVIQVNMNLQHKLDLLEAWWVIQLLAHDEGHGYNAVAGGCRTKGARLRDRERKLMRPNSRKYELLPGVNAYDAIHPALLTTWIPGN